jgi:hypothetical protein
MRIHRVELRNFRGVSHSEVSFPDQGVTIVEGDNEVGKTSLFDGVHLLLEERDSSTKRELREAQPAGTDVGPEVSAEISTGPYRFVLAKRWIRRPETTLTIVSPRREQLTGRAAHERVQAMLTETLDVGLWKALRLEQGADLAQPDFGVPSLGRALDLAAGSNQTGDREDALWEQVVAEREIYWSATGRPKAERTALAARLADAEARVASAAAAIAALDAQADELAGLEVQAADLAERQVELDAAATVLDARLATVTALRTEVRELRSRHQAAAAEQARWTSLVERRIELADRVTRSAAALDAAEAAAKESEPAALAAEARHAAAEVARGTADLVLQAALSRQRRATADEDHRRQQIEVEQLAERRDRVLAEQQALADAEALVRATAVTPELLAAIESAHLEVARAEEAANVAAAIASARALAPVELLVDGERIALEAGGVAELPLTAASELVVPGLVAFTVVPGAEARERADRVDVARRKLSDLCRQGCVADLGEARVAATARADAERVRRDAAARIRGDLRDLTLEALTSKVERLTARIAAYEADRPSEPAMPADHAAAQTEATEAERDLTAAQHALNRADRERNQAAAALNDARIKGAGSAASLEAANIAAAADAAALDEARAELTDEALQAGVAAAAAAADAAGLLLAERDRELADLDPDRLDAQVAAARAAARSGHQAIEANHVRRRELQLTIDLQTEQGLARHLDEAATERDHLTREVAAIEARAAAAAALHDAFAARRDEARGRYAEPFRQQIEELGRMVFGPSLEIELGSDLQIVRRTLDGTTLDWGQLSTGAREQLGLLARLACAMIAAGEGGAPVVFDDALGWTDPTRLAEIGAAIGQAGASCQVIVLTCMPGRYAAVGSATTVRLGAPAAGPGPAPAAGPAVVPPPADAPAPAPAAAATPRKPSRKTKVDESVEAPTLDLWSA